MMKVLPMSGCGQSSPELERTAMQDGDNKEKSEGLVHQIYLAMRWQSTGGMSFKDYADVRIDALKLLGAGNATGLLGIAAFLASTGNKAHAAVVVAKVCICLFSLGIVFFGLGVWYMYGWRAALDDALASALKFNTLDNTVIQNSLATAEREFFYAGGFGIGSIACVCLGGFVVIVGILVFY
jgi:hypothetical protein